MSRWAPLEYSTDRVEGMGQVPHVRCNAGAAWATVFLISGRIEAHAFSVDEIFLLPELYVAAHIERGKWLREVMVEGEASVSG